MPAIIDRAPSRDGPTEATITSVQRKLWQLVNARPEDLADLVTDLTQRLPEDDATLHLWLSSGQMRLVAAWLPALWRQAAVCALRQGESLSKPEIQMVEAFGLDQDELNLPPDAPPEP